MAEDVARPAARIDPGSLYIYFESPRIPKVQMHIAIQNGKLVRASITTVDAKGTAKHEDRKAP